MPIATATYERLAGNMLEIYEEAERRMLQKVSRRLIRGIESKGWTERKYAEVSEVRKEIQAVLNDLRKQRGPLMNNVITRVFGEGIKAFTTEAERFTGMLGISSLSPGSLKVARILGELNDKLNAADRVILRRANDAYADIIGRVSAQVASGTTTVHQAVQDAVDDFAEKGITSFVDKAGRVWEMSTYAEMAILTAIGNATRAGYFDTMAAYGYDLVIVSAHAGACPLCEAWQGVVLSVSGDNRQYLSVGDAEAGGLFHPRCLHHLSVYHDDAHEGARTSPREVDMPSGDYTNRQRQRYYERQVRRWKRRMAAATDAKTERYAFNRVHLWQGRIRSLLSSRATDFLPRKYWREGGRQVLQFK